MPTYSDSRTPRTDSLHHRLLHLKDANGNPSPFFDDLLFFLDDPPPGENDRWQKGADLCAQHGIETSRVAVWRFYRTSIVQWRRDQEPASNEPPPGLDEITKLEQQVRYLAAQRALDLLKDPRLQPAQLIALMRQHERFQKTDLSRDQFKDKIELREQEQRRARFLRIEQDAYDKCLAELDVDPIKKMMIKSMVPRPGST